MNWEHEKLAIQYNPELKEIHDAVEAVAKDFELRAISEALEVEEEA